MGLILDSSAVVAIERKGRSILDLLTNIRAKVGTEPIAISTVSVVELGCGIWRAKDPAQGLRRRKFLDDLFAAVPSYPLTFEIAQRAARISGEAGQQGVVIPFQDLLIGSTALEFDYGVATHNLRHFQLIPNLKVTEL